MGITGPELEEARKQLRKMNVLADKIQDQTSHPDATDRLADLWSDYRLAEGKLHAIIPPNETY